MFFVSPENVIGKNFLFKKKGTTEETISPRVFTNILPATFRQLYQWAGRSERDHTKPATYKIFVSSKTPFETSVEVSRIPLAIKQAVEKACKRKDINAYLRLKIDQPPPLK